MCTSYTEHGTCVQVTRNTEHVYKLHGTRNMCTSYTEHGTCVQVTRCVYFLQRIAIFFVWYFFLMCKPPLSRRRGASGWGYTPTQIHVATLTILYLNIRNGSDSCYKFNSQIIKLCTTTRIYSRRGHIIRVPTIYTHIYICL